MHQERASASRPEGVLVCGTDIVLIEDLARAIEIGGEAVLARFFTDAERQTCRDSIARLAARLAAKEAIAKSLGTGLRGIGWREIEVVTHPNGRPELNLSGRALAAQSRLGIRRWRLSLSNSSEYALAFVVGDASSQPAEVGATLGLQMDGIASAFEQHIITH